MPVKLNTLKKNQTAMIVGVSTDSFSANDQELIRERLTEMGFISGERVAMRYKGPIGGDPLAVEVRGALVGLGRREAECILCEPVEN